jgi:hypothetical protein
VKSGSETVAGPATNEALSMDVDVDERVVCLRCEKSVRLREMGRDITFCGGGDQR